jgi:general stress protein 26
MTNDAAITADFWKRLRSDRLVMLGLEGDTPTSLRPMSAQLDTGADAGPIWFFSSTTASVVQGLADQDLALFSFVSKGQDIFATVHGHLIRSTDRTVIDRLWTPSVAEWYKGGKDDPSLALLRFAPTRAEIWRDATGFLAGLSLLFGTDPKPDARSNVAKVALA